MVAKKTAKKASVRKTAARKADLKKRVATKKKTGCRIPAQNKAKARVQIAKDAIAQVRMKKFKVTNQGFYVNLGATIEQKDVGAPLEVKFSNRTTVCALGGLFVSEVAKNNEIKINQHWTGSDEVSEIDVMRPRLRKYFSDDQMELIESCFEMSWCFERSGLHYRSVFPGPASCFIAICENIIRNNGTFEPEQDDPDMELENTDPVVPPDQKKLVKDIRALAVRYKMGLSDVSRSVLGASAYLGELDRGETLMTPDQIKRVNTQLHNFREDLILEKKITGKYSFSRDS